MSSRKLFYMTTVCTFLLSFNHATAETFVCQGGTCEDKQIAGMGDYDEQMDVNEGGIANNTDVAVGGVVNVNDGGVANQTSVSDGGTLNVNKGGTINMTTSNSGWGGFIDTKINVNDGGTANRTKVEDGVSMNANAGSTVSNTNVGGTMNVEAGATVDKVLVDSDATLNLKDGASVSNIGSWSPEDEIEESAVSGHISAGKDVVIDGLLMGERGSFDFSTDMTIKNGKYEKDYGETQEKTFSIENNKADGFIINGGSSFTITENGSLSNSVVKGPDDGYGSGGKLISVDKNTSIDNVTIEEGGRFEISTDTTVSNSTNNGQNISIKDHVADGFVLDNGQSLIVRGDGTANGTVVNQGKLTAESGAKLNDTTVNGSLDIVDGVTADNTNINAGGSLNVAGGSLNNTTVAGEGKLTADGGKFDGLTMEEGSRFDLTTDVEIADGKQQSADGENAFSIADKKAEGLHVTDGNKFTVKGDGAAENTLVASGGSITVDGSGKVNNLTIENGGGYSLSSTNTATGVVVKDSEGNEHRFNIADNKAVDAYLTANGSLSVDRDGLAQNTTIDGGTLSVNSGAVDGTHLKSGRLDLNDSLKVTNTTVDGGSVTFENSAADGMVINGGSVDVRDGESSLANGIVNGGSLRVGGSTYGLIVNGGSVSIVSGGMADNTVVNGGSLDMKGTMKNTVIKDGGSVTGSSLAVGNVVFENTVVEKGGSLTMGNIGKNKTFASGTLVESGSLTVRYKTELTDLTAEKDSILDINKDVVMKGDILIDRQAVMGGSFDYNSIFTSENISSLTVSNGINDIFKDTLINNAKGKNLVFKDGKYDITGGAAEEGSSLATVSGWNNIGIEGSENRQAAVSLFGDLAYDGTLNIGRFGTLDFAQNNLKLSGDVENEGVLSLANGKESGRRATVAGDYTAKSGALLHVNVDSEKEVSDVLKIDGDVKGSTGVVAHVVSEDVKPENKILFVEAPNDDASTAADFSIYRVYGSAYNWGTVHENNNWYLNGNSNEVTGEVVAYAGLPSAAFEQTRNVVGNVFAKAANDKDNCGNCGLYDHAWDGKKLSNLWVVPGYHSAKVDSPFEFDADIYGLEAGYDVQLNPYHKLGLFVSYRQGEYDFSGKGDDYYAKTGGSINIDSYLAGLYHRYDTQIKGRSAWLMSSLYGGWQKADLKSDDGVKADTDGLEYGAALEAGVVFMPATDVMVEPTVGVRYVHIDFDTVRDGLGKTARYDDVSETELEFGVKAEKTFEYGDGYAKLFVKPSVVQTFGDGDVRITSLGSVSGLEDMTLGRVIVGGSMDFTKQLNGFADVGYTFGGDYRDLNFNLGVNYAF